MREGRRDLGSDFEVVELPTRDRNVARDMIKDIILQRTGDLNFALRRFREKPLRSHP